MSRLGGRPLAILLVTAAIGAAPVLRADSFSVLYNFDGLDASDPQSPLVLDAAGDLFGTSPFGGSQGTGSLFEVPVGGGLNTAQLLYSFTGGSDGGVPFAELTPDGQGNFFGVASEGGSSKAGTLFELVGNGSSFTFTLVYTFTGGADGALPTGGLVIDASGTLYGTTLGGAAGSGTIFALHRDNGTVSLETLYTFSPLASGTNADGANPEATLLLDAAGDLFGTTAFGGASGAGVVFELGNGAGGRTYSVLHTFSGSSDGGVPEAALTPDAEGNLFGTASGDQGAVGFGTVFELVNDGAWTFHTLYAFANSDDGSVPLSSVVIDAAGDLIGTAAAGGSVGAGTIYELGREGDNTFSFRVLHTFDGFLDGEAPAGGLVAGANGVLYGTTELQGFFTFGTLFQLVPPPTAEPVLRVTAPGVPVQISLAAADPNLASPSFTFAISSGPAHGSLSGPSGASVTYTPASGFRGTDSFTFTATDANGTSVPGVVTITVSAPETRHIVPIAPVPPARVSPPPPA